MGGNAGQHNRDPENLRVPVDCHRLGALSGAAAITVRVICNGGKSTEACVGIRSGTARVPVGPVYSR